MIKNTFLIILIAVLASCSSLKSRSAKLEVGATRADVAAVMGPAPYDYTYENVDAWRYAVVAGFGFCDYREFYIYRDSLVYKNEYHHASFAGCTIGLKDIDWEPVFAAVNEYEIKNPSSDNEVTVVSGEAEDDRYDQIREAKQLFDEGILTEEEYEAEKDRILDAP